MLLFVSSVPGKARSSPVDPAADSHATSQPAITEQDGSDNCKICLSGPLNAAFVDCFHMYCCYTCALKVKNNGGRCPLCRQDILSVQNLFVA